jgi:hypothetical protein
MIRLNFNFNLLEIIPNVLKKISNHCEVYSSNLLNSHTLQNFQLNSHTLPKIPPSRLDRISRAGVLSRTFEEEAECVAQRILKAWGGRTIHFPAYSHFSVRPRSRHTLCRLLFLFFKRAARQVRKNIKREKE